MVSVAYKNDTNYYKSIQNKSSESIILENGFFVKEFPIENQYHAITESNVSEYKDLIDTWSPIYYCRSYHHPYL